MVDDGYNFCDGLSPGMSEAHVVKGIELSDGRFVVVGSATPDPDRGGNNAFAVMIKADGSFV